MATNWVGVVQQTLEERAPGGWTGSVQATEAIRRAFVAHELVVAEVAYVRELEEHGRQLRDQVADLQGRLTSYAAVLLQLGSDMMAKGQP